MEIINNRRRTGILVIVFGLLLLAVIVYFVFFYDFSQTTTPENTVPDVEQTTQGVVPQNMKVPEEVVRPEPDAASQTEPIQEDVRQLASSFAERFGSWSNQTGAGNIADLKLFMTSNMKAWADDYIESSSLGNNDYEQYYGITTKAVVAEVLDYQTNSAQVLVKTKRTETKNNQTKEFNQDLLLKLLKVGQTWKVDSANWQ